MPRPLLGVKTNGRKEKIMTGKLEEMKCGPCMKGAAPLEGERLRVYAEYLPNWKVVRGHHLERTFSFDDFKSALAFTNVIGGLSEEEGHHPDITLSWGSVGVNLHTHKIDGLTENDFILAAKFEKAYGSSGEAESKES
jgi:4a-hydroxytetrahydrobiopterin dehydratase